MLQTLFKYIRKHKESFYGAFKRKTNKSMNSTNDYSRVGGIVGLIRELYKSTAATLQEAIYPSDREVKISLRTY